MKTHFYTTERERDRQRDREREKKIPIPKDASFYQPAQEVNNLGVRN